MRTDFLSKDDEYALVRRAQDGDARARESLVRAYMPLAHRMAAQSRSQLELADRQQIAMMALNQSIDRFDPARGYRLSTYAKPRISRDLSDEGAKAASRLNLGASKERRSAHHNAIAACGQLGLDSEKRLTDDQAQAVADLIRSTPHNVRAALETGQAAFCVDVDELVDNTTAEELLAIRDENEAREALLRDALAELDEMDRELAENALADKPEGVVAIMRRHGARGRAGDAAARATEELIARARVLAFERGLLDEGAIHPRDGDAR